MITEDYVSFKTAKLLKEKGFDECPLFYYDDCGQFWVKGGYDKTKKWHFPAPTLQMAMKWLREKHNKFIEICTDKSHNFNNIIFRPFVYNKELDCLWESDNFSTYEQACEAAIKYCLENLV